MRREQGKRGDSSLFRRRINAPKCGQFTALGMPSGRLRLRLWCRSGRQRVSQAEVGNPVLQDRLFELLLRAQRAGEVRAPDIAILELEVSEVRLTEAGMGDFGALEGRPAKIGAGEIRIAQIRTVEPCRLQLAAGEIQSHP